MAGQMIKKMSQLRATAASELFHAGVPERVIQQRTGHLGLRRYEKVTTTQQQAVCRVLSVNTNSTYDNEVSRMSFSSTSSAVPSSHSTELQLHKLYQAHLQQLQLYRK